MRIPNYDMTLSDAEIAFKASKLGVGALNVTGSLGVFGDMYVHGDIAGSLTFRGGELLRPIILTHANVDLKTDGRWKRYWFVAPVPCVIKRARFVIKESGAINVTCPFLSFYDGQGNRALTTLTVTTADDNEGDISTATFDAAEPKDARFMYQGAGDPFYASLELIAVMVGANLLGHLSVDLYPILSGGSYV